MAAVAMRKPGLIHAPKVQDTTKTPQVTQVAPPVPETPQTAGVTIKRRQTPKQAPQRTQMTPKTPSVQQTTGQPSRKAPKRIIKEVDGVDMVTGKPKKIKMDVTPQAGVGNPYQVPTPGIPPAG